METTSSCSYNYSTQEEFNYSQNGEDAQDITSPIRVPDTQDVFAELKLSVEEPIEAALERAKQISLEVGSHPSQQEAIIAMTPIEMYELLWEAVFPQLILPALKEVERACVKKRNLTWKKIITQIILITIETFKIMKKESMDMLTCSFEQFNSKLQRNESSMTYMKQQIPQELADLTIIAFSANIPRLWPRRPLPRCPRLHSWEYTINHWQNLTVYFEEEGRVLLYVDLARRNARTFSAVWTPLWIIVCPITRSRMLLETEN